MGRRAAARSVAVLALVALSGVSGAARGAGLYLSDRGVRPLARGGAFVAGADDAGAIAYNPAGLFEAGGQVLVDGSWVNFSSEYTRMSRVRQVDPNTGETTQEFVQTFPRVEGTTPFLPIPTLAGSLRVNKQWVVGAGVWAPYAALAGYPETVGGGPAPQRYSLLSLDGSALAFVGVGAAHEPIPNVRVGATVGVITGLFTSRVVFSGCVPERFFCAPEDPDWDGLAEVSAAPIIAPTGQLGAIWVVHPKWRVGASFQLPAWVRAPAKIRARLPGAAVFEKATQEGEDADINFELPWSLRLGVETRIVENLRVEAGFGYEGWGMHDTIEVDPDGIVIRNIAGFPETYHIPSVALERRFQGSFSLRLGGEYAFSVAGHGFEGRAGVSYESSAVPREYFSVLTLDPDKVTASLGLGVHVGPFRFDVTYARMFAPDVTVGPDEARIPQVSPVRANPSEYPNYINGGVYSASANIVGLGAAYTFDPQVAEPAAKKREGSPGSP